MATSDPLKLSDGTVINPTFIRDYDAGHSYDYDGPLQQAGYLKLGMDDPSWINQNYGTNFQSGDQVRDYLYGIDGKHDSKGRFHTEAFTTEA